MQFRLLEQPRTSIDSGTDDVDDQHAELLRDGFRKIEAGLDIDEDLNSPAAIVRKCVPETDDPTQPSLTFRVIVLGTMLCVLGGQ